MSSRIRIKTGNFIGGNFLMPYSMAAFQKGTRLTVYFESEGEVLLLYIKEFGTELRKKSLIPERKTVTVLQLKSFLS